MESIINNIKGHKKLGVELEFLKSKGFEFNDCIDEGQRAVNVEGPDEEWHIFDANEMWAFLWGSYLRNQYK